VTAPAERAARLLRWYPRGWRSRYGEEFAELLVTVAMLAMSAAMAAPAWRATTASPARNSADGPRRPGGRARAGAR
jgi:hypothetical protein